MVCALLFFVATLFSPINSNASPYYWKIPIIEKRLDPSARVLAWQTSLPTIIENPVFGRGLGMPVADVRYESPTGFQHLTDAHQMWLNIAGQAGLFGFSALCVICIFFSRQTFPFNFADSKAVLRTALGLAFSSAFLYQGLTGSFEDSRHLWVLFGLLGSITENKFAEKT